MRHFFFDFLPNIYSFFFSPKFLFVMGNIIVIILVGESKLRATGSSCSSPANEIYDEYLERSRSLKRSHEMEKNEKTSSSMRRYGSLNNVRSSVEVAKKKELGGRNLRRPRSVIERKERPVKMHENEKTHSVKMRPESLCSLHLHDENEKTGFRLVKILENENMGSGHQSLTRPQSLGRLDLHDDENKKTGFGEMVGQSLTRPQSLCRLDLHDENKKRGLGEMVGQSLTRPQSLCRLNLHEDENEKTSLEEKKKEMEQSKDELNRRVEAFIERVNRQRILEAKELDFHEEF